MTWDFAESNPLGAASGNYVSATELVTKVIDNLHSNIPGVAMLGDASIQMTSLDKLISTDPPYYDNIGYADLSDFFYVWLRHSLRPVFPDLFATMAVPKAGFRKWKVAARVGPICRTSANQISVAASPGMAIW